ncbi:hypothetical protein M434DRAFT_35816 [Hypoxylon sp. CO27-5]|nr:hypothetical protein M434DRAFT_35816 [Hypoxylon sp. CO27-5]
MSRALTTQSDVEVALNGYVTPGEDYFNRGTVSPGLSISNREQREKRPPPISLPGPNAESLARMISNARKPVRGRKKIGIRDRICCHQWTWFTMVCLDKCHCILDEILMSYLVTNAHLDNGNWRRCERPPFHMDPLPG